MAASIAAVRVAAAAVAAGAGTGAVPPDWMALLYDSERRDTGADGYDIERVLYCMEKVVQEAAHHLFVPARLAVALKDVIGNADIDTLRRIATQDGDAKI